MPDRNHGGLSFPVRITVGQHEYDLGEVSGATPFELTDNLSRLLAGFARAARGPSTSPAPPCEGCGADMVYRSTAPGRFTVEARTETGEPSIFGVHNVNMCLQAAHRRRMEREAADRRTADAIAAGRRP